MLNKCHGRIFLRGEGSADRLLGITPFLYAITPILDDNSKNKNRRIFSLFFPYYTAHSPSSMKIGSKQRGGVCISLSGKNPKYWTKSSFCVFGQKRKLIKIGRIQVMDESRLNESRVGRKQRWKKTGWTKMNWTKSGSTTVYV